MNRRNRSWCGLLLFATIGAHFAGKHYGPLSWAVLVLQFLVYPQLLYWRARRASNQRQAEMNNLTIDAVCFGIWAAALGFPVWITFIFLVTATVNMTVFRGRKGYAHALAFICCGALLEVAAAGFHFSPDTDWPATLFSILTVSIYVLVVAENAYARAVKLHETREQLQASELALKQQLNEISALQAQLREQANRDPLTGLYNRRFFDASLERELARCKRDGQPLSIVIIDIDHFKHINDTYGHQAGDEVLKSLARLLERQVRASDVACRFGGEEFVLLLPTLQPQTALERAEEWRIAFAAQVVGFEDSRIQATLSIGIATYPDHGALPGELIRCADLALYRAKTAGRNRTAMAHRITGVAA